MKLREGYVQWEIWAAISAFFSIGFGIMGLLFRKAESAAERAVIKADTAQQCVDVLKQQLCDHVDAANMRFDLFEKHANERHQDIKTSIAELKVGIRSLRNGKITK